MQQIHQKHQSELDKCLVVCQNTANPTARMGLHRLYVNCKNLWVEMDREFVECRRKGRLTLKYTELESKFSECIYNFEQWELMAKLLYA
jgi:hypothetical protein